MPERQSTPGGVTAEQDAEAQPDDTRADGIGADGNGADDTRADGIGAHDIGAHDTAAHDTAAHDAAEDEPTCVVPSSVDAVDQPSGFDAPTSATESPIFVVHSPVTPDAEATQVIAARGASEDPTVQISAAPPEGPAPEISQPWRKRAMLISSAVVAALGLLYGADLLLSSGSIPRGVTVGGVPVGGVALADAEQTLRAQLEPRTQRPVPVTVGDAKTTVDPRAAGLSVDWAATVARASAQPLNPVTRITSLFSSRETGVVTRSDPAALDAALTELAPAFDKPAVEGNVRFDGVTPEPVQPVPGQQLDVQAAADALDRNWVSGAPVVLPLTRLAPMTTADNVATALEKVAKPAVSGPVTITGENAARATLTPSNIAAALSFHADPAAGLVPELNQDSITAVLKPQLAGSETPGRDATLDFTGPTPVVVPSQDGRGVDYPATLKALIPVLTGTGQRQLAAVYAPQPAKLTTDGLSKLGISGIIGEFTTHGFASDSGMNIKRAAAQINGTIIAPGATFSLNAATNPRDAAHGYVEAGIIEDGHPARGIGGGVSQVATTLYNASYFAGMANVEHRE
ncbi:MAG: VanW family protein, partial [Pseudonocardiales bacterium]|nr:VanW family protein [Pseudonocardiales bacterium]